MVFPSVPLYLDPPNWNHQHQAQQIQQQQLLQPGNGGDYHQLQPGSAQRSEGAMVAPAARPGSMADRARLAKLPQPEPALKCPRCDSTNTKFCYFNNYSLSQPRHFCKTCRRYWTRGGALRNVPVGGGCRRNKRSKSTGSSSKSQSANAGGATSSSSAAATTIVGGIAPANIGSAPQMPFMSSLHHLAEFSAPNLGLNFTGMQPIDAVDYQVGGSSSVGLEQWRLQQIQQFPFFGGLEAAAPAPVQGLYAFDHGEGGGGVDTSVFAAAPAQAQKASSSGLITQMASVKMEDSSQGLNLQRPYLSMARNEQYWGGADGVGGSGGIGGNSVGGWMTNLSGFNSSSSGNLL